MVNARTGTEEDRFAGLEISAQRRVVDIVTRIFATKVADPAADTTAQEWKIDGIVHKLCRLTEEGIAIVEGKVE
jgi:hypothetical protein